MRLTRLKTENFRNLAAVDVTPAPGVNVIYGENAQGKTNLIEAIYLLTGQKSFRAAKESDYLRFGQEVARIEAEFTCQNREKTAALAYGSKKLAWLNGVECAPSELTGEFLAVVFSPGELALIQEGPSERPRVFGWRHQPGDAPLYDHPGRDEPRSAAKEYPHHRYAKKRQRRYDGAPAGNLGPQPG